MGEADYKPVLFIEDDPDLLEVMKLALEFSGFRVYGASDGQQALEVLRSIEKPAVIFMDLGMAGMDGSHFRTIQQSDPTLSNIHVVVMSGSSTHDMETQIPPCETVSYLRKPASLDQVIDLAKSYCA